MTQNHNFMVQRIHLGADHRKSQNDRQDRVGWVGQVREPIPETVSRDRNLAGHTHQVSQGEHDGHQ